MTSTLRLLRVFWPAVVISLVAGFCLVQACKSFTDVADKAVVHLSASSTQQQRGR